MNKLYKSSNDKKLCGVCGGLAECLGIDSTIVRLIWAVVSLLSVGTGVLIYLAAALIMPNAD